MKRRIVKLVLLLVLLLLVVVVAFTQFVALPGGPLEGRAAGDTSATIGADTAYTVQAFTLANDSGRTLTIEEIEVPDLDDDVELLGTDVARRVLDVPAVAPGYPPPADAGVLRRPDGAEVRRSARIVFGVRVRRPGRNPRLSGVKVRYRDRGLLRSVELDGRVTLRTR